ncbi:hypothetical protein SteCoe_36161 [Stentor coeruleus]|uniref:FACT complex subunit SSRP1 n=1 Tax=Stentor coeruleus TaxID=5963 RepID=A0A1R2AQQ8_9CILI|nr:hypothetical protein SteCoe_36161 [Stentor coeruleus]
MANLSAKGWSWGEYQINEGELQFLVDKKPCFNLNFKDIITCSVPGKNEVAFEFQQKDTNDDDTLCEMRIFIPETDSCEGLAKELSERSENKASTVDALVSLYDLPMIVPRGKYSLDMFQSFMRLHGKTHNYKIIYKNVTRAFLLPKPDGIHIAMVIALDSPIRQGNTVYPFIVVQFSKDSHESTTLNMPIEEIKRSFGEELTQTLEGKSFDIMSKLLKAMVKTMIIVPGNFKSKNDTSAIKCSVKASEGYLYPLQKSFIFINKPVIYIKFEDIRYIEFARIGEESVATNRSFDINICTKNGNFQFTGVDREEYQIMLEFLHKKKIQVRNVEEEPKEAESSDDNLNIEDENDSDDESFNASDLD